MKDSVIFDMDGVLLDSERIYNEAWRRVGRKLGLLDIETCIAHCVGRNGRDIESYLLDKFGPAFPAEQIRADIRQAFAEITSVEGLPLKPGAADILFWLKESGVNIGLATSTNRASAVRQLENAGLLAYFSAVVTGDMIRNGKPDPEIYLQACRMLSAVPESCFAIEDSPNGIKSAHAAGLKVIMVPDLIAPTPELEKLLHRRFDTLLDVKAYFENQQL